MSAMRWVNGGATVDIRRENEGPRVDWEVIRVCGNMTRTGQDRTKDHNGMMMVFLFLFIFIFFYFRDTGCGPLFCSV
jgi:hypothetical protein